MRYDESRTRSPSQRRGSRSLVDAKERYYPTRHEEREGDIPDPEEEYRRNRDDHRDEYRGGSQHRREEEYRRRESPYRRRESRGRILVDDSDDYPHPPNTETKFRKRDHDDDYRQRDESGDDHRKRDHDDDYRTREEQDDVYRKRDHDDYGRRKESDDVYRKRDQDDDSRLRNESDVYRKRDHEDYRRRESPYCRRESPGRRREERVPSRAPSVGEDSGQHSPETEEALMDDNDTSRERNQRNRGKSVRRQKNRQGGDNWQKELSNMYEEVFSGRSISKSGSSSISSGSYSSEDEDEFQMNANCMNTLFNNKDPETGMQLIRCDKAGPSATEVQLKMTLPIPRQLMENFDNLVPTKSGLESAIESLRFKSGKLAKKCDLDYSRLEEQVIIDDELPGGVMPQFYKSLFEAPSDASSEEEEESDEMDELEEPKFVAKRRAVLVEALKSTPSMDRAGSLPSHIVIDENASSVSSHDSLEMSPIEKVKGTRQLPDADFRKSTPNQHSRDSVDFKARRKQVPNDSDHSSALPSPRAHRCDLGDARNNDFEGAKLSIPRHRIHKEDELRGEKLEEEHPSFDEEMAPKIPSNNRKGLPRDTENLHDENSRYYGKEKNALSKFTNPRASKDWIPAKKEQLDLVDQGYPSFDAPEDEPNLHQKALSRKIAPTKEKLASTLVGGFPATVGCEQKNGDRDLQTVYSDLTSDEDDFDQTEYPIVKTLSLSDKSIPEDEGPGRISSQRVSSKKSKIARETVSSSRWQSDEFLREDGKFGAGFPDQDKLMGQKDPVKAHADDIQDSMEPTLERSVISSRKSLGSPRAEIFVSRRGTRERKIKSMQTKEGILHPGDELMGPAAEVMASKDDIVPSKDVIFEHEDELISSRSKAIRSGDEITIPRDETNRVLKVSEEDELISKLVQSKHDASFRGRSNSSVPQYFLQTEKLSSSDFEGDELMRNPRAQPCDEPPALGKTKQSASTSRETESDSKEFAVETVMSEEIPMDEGKSRQSFSQASKSDRRSSHSDSMLQSKSSHPSFAKESTEASSQSKTQSTPVMDNTETRQLDSENKAGVGMATDTIDDLMGSDADPQHRDFNARLKSAAAARLDALDGKLHPPFLLSKDCDGRLAEKDSQNDTPPSLETEAALQKENESDTLETENSAKPQEINSDSASVAKERLVEESKVLENRTSSFTVEGFAEYCKKLTQWDKPDEAEEEDTDTDEVDQSPNLETNDEAVDGSSESGTLPSAKSTKKAGLLSEIDARSQAVEVNYMGGHENETLADDPSLATMNHPLVINPTSNTMETPLTTAQTTFTMDTPVGTPPGGTFDTVDRSAWADPKNHKGDEKVNDFYRTELEHDDEDDYHFDERMAKLSSLLPASKKSKQSQQKRLVLPHLNVVQIVMNAFMAVVFFFSAWLNHMTSFRSKRLSKAGKVNTEPNFRSLKVTRTINATNNEAIQGSTSVRRRETIEDDDGTTVEFFAPEVHSSPLWTIPNPQSHTWKPEIVTKTCTSIRQSCSDAKSVVSMRGWANKRLDARSVASMKGWSAKSSVCDSEFHEE